MRACVDIENKFTVSKGEAGWAGISWETEIDVFTRFYIRQTTNEDFLYRTANSTQHSAVTYMGKESKKSAYV